MDGYTIRRRVKGKYERAKSLVCKKRDKKGKGVEC